MKSLSVEDILHREYERRMATMRPADLRASPPPPYEGKKRGPRKRATEEMAAAWSAEQQGGTAYSVIAKRVGLHVATVQRAVSQWRKAQRERLAS
ncbi:MAG: hypothetical protein ACOZQL_10515 [Myxococcota bacterium]